MIRRVYSINIQFSSCAKSVFVLRPLRRRLLVVRRSLSFVVRRSSFVVGRLTLIFDDGTDFPTALGWILTHSLSVDAVGDKAGRRAGGQCVESGDVGGGCFAYNYT